MEGGPSVAACYLCLDGGADDDDAGRSLRRDCACRGTDAGFVHLACLAKYSAAKSKGWDGRDMNEFTKPWRVCPSCLQEYQNELSIDIASKFASFVRRQYPDDTHVQVEALYMKLCALMDIFDRLKPVQKSELGVTATVLLSFIKLKANKELYEMRVAELGKEHEYTILAGRSYAIALRNAKRGEEARELLMKLLATSKQVLGPHHSTTRAVDNALIRINFITFIKSSVFVCILIGVMAMLYQLAKS